MLLDKISFYKLIRNLMLIEMERSNLMTLQNYMMQPNIQMSSLEIKVLRMFTMNSCLNGILRKSMELSQ